MGFCRVLEGFGKSNALDDCRRLDNGGQANGLVSPVARCKDIALLELRCGWVSSGDFLVQISGR